MAGQTPAYRPPPSAQHREPPTPTDHEPLLYEVEDQARNPEVFLGWAAPGRESWPGPSPPIRRSADPDRKSTRLNSSHRTISYAVFCLKTKKHPTTARGRGPAH